MLLPYVLLAVVTFVLAAGRPGVRLGLALVWPAYWLMQLAAWLDRLEERAAGEETPNLSLEHVTDAQTEEQEAA